MSSRFAMIETKVPIDFGPEFGVRYISEIRRPRFGEIFMPGYREALILPFDWNPNGHMERDGEWLELIREANARGMIVFAAVDRAYEYDGYTVPLFRAPGS